MPTSKTTLLCMGFQSLCIALACLAMFAALVSAQLPGETIETAIQISGLPYSHSSSTCDYADDYDEDCPWSSNAPDVVFSYNPPQDLEITIDLCGSSFDTKVFVYDDLMNEVECNDDACGQSGYRSFVHMNVVGGASYFVIVDGFGGGCGDYTMLIREVEPLEFCDLPCDGVNEQEMAAPCEYDTNLPIEGNVQVLEPDENGEVTICGNTHLIPPDKRDTDWYLGQIGPSGHVEARIYAQHETRLYLMAMHDGSDDVECGEISIIEVGYGEDCVIVDSYNCHDSVADELTCYDGDCGQDVIFWVGLPFYEPPPGYPSSGSNYRIEISGLLPVSSTIDAVFSAHYNDSTGEVDFLDLSSGNPDHWRWEFGDGTQSTDRNPHHTYPLGCSGPYSVHLTAWDSACGGGVDTSPVQEISLPVDPECEKPIALIVDYADGPAGWLEEVTTAKRNLERKGWDAEIIPNSVANWDSISARIRANKCIQGLWMVGHGNSSNNDIKVLAGPVWVWKSVSNLKADLVDHNLQFLTVLKCYMDYSEFAGAFGDLELFGPYIPDSNGIVNPHLEVIAMQFFGWGVSKSACPSTESLLDVVCMSGLGMARGADYCPSFALCDSDGCGNEIFPTITCADSVGVATDGLFALVEANSEFAVQVHVDPVYGDSLGCFATLFENMPREMMIPDRVDINRHMFVGSICSDSLYTPDSLSITMKYASEDLIPEYGEENALRVFWKSFNSDFIQIEATQSLEDHSFSFTTQALGVAGIYYVDSFSEVVDALPTTAQGVGAAWVDYQSDGVPDLFLTNNGTANILFRNESNGNFTMVGDEVIGNTGTGHAGVWADYDSDGLADLYLVNYEQPNCLLRNLGGGEFADVASGELSEAGPYTGATWVDYNIDGLLDLYLTVDGASNILFKNALVHEGTMYVVNVTGPGGGTESSQAAAWADFDNDGDQDVFIVNRNEENHLYENIQDFGFVELTGNASINDIGDGASATWGDYDGDGFLDLYVVNDGQPDLLLKNTGSGFERIMHAPLFDSGNGRSASWGDFDNDGDLDLYVSRHEQQDLYLRNDGGDQFLKVDFFTEGTTGSGGSVALADYDGDGDLDIYLANYSDNKLLENLCQNGNSWLHVDLVGGESNRSAIGARIRIVTGSISQIREINGGSGSSSQNSPTVEFGLGENTVVDSLIIQWPSGLGQIETQVAVNQRLIIIEGETVSIDAHDDSVPPATSICQAYPNPFNPVTTIQYNVSKEASVDLRIHDVAGRLVRTLIDDEYHDIGRYYKVWDGRDQYGRSMTAGVYFCRFEAEELYQAIKLVLLK
ncbi:MAG: PKD domain-containing protein [bacterium]|nr:PKD domain-containing protein [bacterium]